MTTKESIDINKMTEREFIAKLERNLHYKNLVLVKLEDKFAHAKQGTKFGILLNDMRDKIDEFTEDLKKKFGFNVVLGKTFTSDVFAHPKFVHVRVILEHGTVEDLQERRIRQFFYIKRISSKQLRKEEADEYNFITVERRYNEIKQYLDAFDEWRKKYNVDKFKTKIYVRSKHAGKFPYFGPDKYVMVLVAEKNAEFPKVLRKDIIEQRHILALYFGEGYSKYTGPNSKIGNAERKAKYFVEYLKTHRY